MGDKRVQAYQLTVRNFKRVEEVTIDFDGNVHRICGDVRQGKTSLIEALQSLANEFNHPDMVRQGADRAEVELVTNEGTVTCVIPAAGEQWEEGKRKWGTRQVTDANGMAMEEGEAFLAALFGKWQFRPIDFVLLGSGDPRHRTERMRLQRDMLLYSLPVTLSKKELRKRLTAMPEPVKEAVKKVNLASVDFEQHAGLVCDACRDECSKGLTGANADLDRARNVLELAPAPEGMLSPKTVAECAADVEQSHEAYVSGRARCQGFEERIRARDALRAEVKQGGESLPKRAKVESARVTHQATVATHQATVHAHQVEVTRIEEEIKRLQDQLADEREKQKAAEEQQKAAEKKVQQCDALIEKIGAHEAREKDLATLDAALASGREDVDVEGLKAEWEAAKELLESRKRQEAHDAAAATVAVAQVESDAFATLVKLFRDTIPNELITQANLGVEGLTITEGRLELNGLPLHQFGTSETIVLAVKLWAAMYPRAPFVPIDRAESLGKEDLAALAGVAAERGFRLIMTFVDAAAQPGPGVTVMEGGKAKEK